MIVYWISYKQNVSVFENVTCTLNSVSEKMVSVRFGNYNVCCNKSLPVHIFPPKDRELWQNKNKNKKIELTNNCYLVCFKKIYLRIFSELPIKTNWDYFLSIKICIIYAKSQPLEHALHIKNHKNIKPNFWQ